MGNFTFFEFIHILHFGSLGLWFCINGCWRFYFFVSNYCRKHEDFRRSFVWFLNSCLKVFLTSIVLIWLYTGPTRVSVSTGPPAVGKMDDSKPSLASANESQADGERGDPTEFRFMEFCKVPFFFFFSSIIFEFQFLSFCCM